MRCRRCDALMVETRKESSETSEQTWFGCPACDTVKMQTQPRPSNLSAVDASMESGLDTGNDQTDLTDNAYVSPLSYSN